MGLNRPTYKVKVSANRKATERKTIFFDIKPDTSARLRVLPPVDESGAIFTKVVNHFRLKNEEGFGMALACLHEHGNDETGEDCYLCNLVNLLRNGDKADQKIANDLRGNPRWYLQAFVYDKDSGTYEGPKLVGVSKTTAESINDILSSQEDSGDDFFCDVDNGQDIVITRRGTGLNTKYTVAPTGSKVSLDEAVPGWENKIITDVMAALELRVFDVDEQKRAAHRSFGDDLDWDTIEEQIG